MVRDTKTYRMGTLNSVSPFLCIENVKIKILYCNILCDMLVTPWKRQITGAAAAVPPLY